VKKRNKNYLTPWSHFSDNHKMVKQNTSLVELLLYTLSTKQYRKPVHFFEKVQLGLGA
jgi:hypothetical protein